MNREHLQKNDRERRGARTAIRLVPGDALTGGELAAWSKWQRANPALSSPYFRPEFTQAVAAVRRDVEVAVLEDDAGLAGFFPFQRSRLNFGRPPGGRLSDFHGVVLRAGATASAADLLRACGLNAWDFTHLPAEQTEFAACFDRVEGSPYLDLSGGFDAYAEACRSRGSRIVRDILKKRCKLDSDVGPVRFEPDVRDPGLLRRLMDCKSQQYRRTGVGDVFAFPWTVALLERLFDVRTEPFCGRLSALYAGDDIVAMHFGIQTQTVLHYWFPAYATAFKQYSPGLVLLLEVARHAAPPGPQMSGIRRLDLGKGDERYKRRLASGELQVAAGSVEASRLLRGVRTCWRTTRGWLKSSRWGGPVRVSARIVRPVREWLSFR